MSQRTATCFDKVSPDGRDGVLMQLGALYGIDFQCASGARHLSGYYGLGDSQWLAAAARELRVGAPVLDKRHLESSLDDAVYTAFVRDVIKAPLVNPREDAEDEPGDSGYRFVTVRTLVGYWRSRGARVGTWNGTSVDWES